MEVELTSDWHPSITSQMLYNYCPKQPCIWRLNSRLTGTHQLLVRCSITTAPSSPVYGGWTHAWLAPINYWSDAL